MKTLKYSPCAGSHIEQACKEAVAMAMNCVATVKFSFNGILMEATPNCVPIDLANEWSTKQEQAAKAYRESPEGIASAEKRKQDVMQKQASVNLAIQKLPSVIHNHGALMEWLKFFSYVADDIGVTYSKGELADQLEAGGYVENEHVGKKPEWFNTRPRLARYIVGQAITCLRGGMGPHPITADFVDKYFNLPSTTP
jgi:hypothetical protein